MYDQIELELALIERPFEQKKRHLDFSGVKNFRDLGGYRTTDGRTVRWRLLYRSGHLHKLTGSDLVHLADLDLDRIIDLRAEYEKKAEPDGLPANIGVRLVEIPILDSTTEIWQDSHDQFIKDHLGNADPAAYLVRTNVELATRFAPEMSRFVHELLSARGRPVLYHCAAGKDRTGYASALILRILGVPLDVVIDDYLLSNRYYFSAYAWSMLLLQLVKGKRIADVVKGFLEVQPAYLSAAFDAVDREFGSFEEYLRAGLGLTGQDIEVLKSHYLE